MQDESMLTRNAKSRELWERSCRVIVGGGQAHKRPVDLMKLGGPAFIAKARGAKFWDVDGHEYLDFLLGYGPIVLGHSDPDVNEAVRQQMEEGTVYSVENPKEIELAEKLIALIPCAEMLMYYVGGSGATSGALRTARAHTGREVIIRCGYHGWHDWCVPDNPGVPLFNRTLIQEVPYNDLPALESKLKSFAGKVAGVMIESIQWGGPESGYFDGVRKLCDEHGAVFILDEVKTGFRFDLGGAQRRFGIDCDISTFGKAMCNGYPGSVLVGKRKFMEGRTDTHMAATFHGDLLSVVAALTVIRVMEERDGIGHFERLGRKLIDGLNGIFSEAEAPLKVIGFPAMPWPVVTGATDDCPCPETFKPQAMNEFCAALQRRGIYATGHPWFLSLAHTDADIDHTLNVATEAVREFKAIMTRAVKKVSVTAK